METGDSSRRHEKLVKPDQPRPESTKLEVGSPEPEIKREQCELGVEEESNQSFVSGSGEACGANCRRLKQVR